MRRLATVWAFAGSALMLGVLTGLCDLAGPTEKAIRCQRIRVRATQPDIDHVSDAVAAAQMKPADKGSAGYALPSANDTLPAPPGYFWRLDLRRQNRLPDTLQYPFPARGPPQVS